MSKLTSLLENGNKLLGTFVHMGGTNVIEALGCTGLDFIVIDNEHGPFEVESSLESIRTAESAGLIAFARVREISRPGINKLLDQGAAGLIIPFVETVDQVKEIINFGKYMPIGKRGFSTARKDRWGFAEPAGRPLQEQLDYWNKETFIVPQCETVGCLEHIEEIAALEGVDGIFVGPIDLSISMGIPADFQNPRMIAAFEHIIKACRTNGKFCMIFTGNKDWIEDYYAMGFDMVAYGADAGMMVNAYKEQIAKLPSLKR